MGREPDPAIAEELKLQAIEREQRLNRDAVGRFAAMMDRFPLPEDGAESADEFWRRGLKTASLIMDMRARLEIIQKDSKRLDSPLNPTYGGGYHYDTQARQHVPVTTETFKLDLADREISFLLTHAPRGDVYAFIPRVAEGLSREGKLPETFVAEMQRRYEELRESQQVESPKSPMLPPKKVR